MLHITDTKSNDFIDIQLFKFYRYQIVGSDQILKFSIQQRLSPKVSQCRDKYFPNTYTYNHLLILGLFMFNHTNPVVSISGSSSDCPIA